MIPPLNQPRCTTGEDLGTEGGGPWLGSDAFYYSVIFENERGEFSTYYQPLAPHAAWSGYPGFGFHQVSAKGMPRRRVRRVREEARAIHSTAKPHTGTP